MAFFSFYTKYLFSRDFKHCFRNVLKLNYSHYNCRYLHNRSTIKLSKSLIFLNRNDTLLYSIYVFQLNRITFRCIRSCKIGFSVNCSSKKKNRNSDETRLKFAATKFRDAKGKVKRKIGEIKENVLTIPNGLCVLRILSSPLLAYLIISELYTASLGLFVFAGFTDLIDGYIARKFPDQQSMIGSFLDPAADKLLIATLFITLTVNGLIPVPLTSMIILRDACLMSAGFYIRFVSLPPPKTIKRYFDMSFVTARLQPTTLSKANTLIQLSLVAASLAAPVFNFVDHFYLHILWYVTGTTTVLSAASYLYYKNATYKMFNPVKEKNK